MPDRLLKSCLFLLLLAAAGAAGAAWELDDAISPQRLSRDLRLELQLSKPDSELSLRQLRARAEAGDVEAQFGLGLSYQTGQGVERDRQQAATGTAGRRRNGDTFLPSSRWGRCIVAARACRRMMAVSRMVRDRGVHGRRGRGTQPGHHGTYHELEPAAAGARTGNAAARHAGHGRP